jgi:hypothetical protein
MAGTLEYPQATSLVRSLTPPTPALTASVSCYTLQNTDNLAPNPGRLRVYDMSCQLPAFNFVIESEIGFKICLIQIHQHYSNMMHYKYTSYAHKIAKATSSHRYTA